MIENINGQQRLEWLDFAKGIAILSVVMGHLSASLNPTNRTWSHLIVVYEMPLFFMLSGILAQKNINNRFIHNINKKLRTLIIPFIVFGSLYAQTFDKWDRYLFNMYHNGYWFLLSLFFCWICFYLCQILIKKIPLDGLAKELVSFIILLCPFFIYKILEKSIPDSINNMLTLNFTFTYYRFFVIGNFILRISKVLKSPLMGGGLLYRSI